MKRKTTLISFRTDARVTDVLADIGRALVDHNVTKTDILNALVLRDFGDDVSEDAYKANLESLLAKVVASRRAHIGVDSDV